MINASPKIQVLCVDDNMLVAEAIMIQLRDAPDIEVIGQAANADELIEKASQRCPDVVLLDYDMPGKPAFDAIGELEQLCDKARVLMYSGYVQADLIDRALEAGAWGYVAKVDGQEELVNAIRQVASGSFAFSSAARAAHGEQ